MRPLEEILEEVKSTIATACAKSDRQPDAVEIIAVTKTHGPEVVSEAQAAGLHIVGENKVQEAAWKKPASVSGMDWHLIGHLQKNKVRPALDLFDFFHSVDSFELAERMNRVATEIGASPHILLEINVAGEASKSGLAPSRAAETIEHILTKCPRLTLEGFMTMAPFVPPEKVEETRPVFSGLRELRDELEIKFGASFPRLSMGMTNDYRIAVEEGATWIRLGTLLFGERPKTKLVHTASDTDAFAGGGLDSFSGEGPVYKILD